MPPSEGAASGLEARLQALLGRIARDPSRPTLDELAAIDEFHTRGREATAELLARLDPPPGSLVLDAGCGLGGPARLLAAERGCIVVGVDLDPGNVALARRLTLATGLGDRVRLAVADVSALPFPGGTFDHAISQHVAMSVAGKPALYRELRRVLRRGGRLGIYDLAAGPGGPPLLPAPWASDEAGSHLEAVETTRAFLAEAGFALLDEGVDAAAARAWAGRLLQRLERDSAAPPLLGLLFPGRAGEIARNLSRNLIEGRTVPFQLVAEVR
ncbi:MAG TPA: class I SAM-dependent methyltransferase [Geminicoccaceae bacterium]